MSDPFADLLSSFKNEASAAKKDPVAVRNEAQSPLSVSATISDPEIHDDFDELFGHNSISIGGFGQQQAAEDEFDAAFKAFDEDLNSPDKAEDEPEFVVDEVRDMEVAKLMSLGLSIEKATSYYDKGILYEELVKKQREKESLRAQRTQRAHSRSPLQMGESAGLFSVASGLLQKGKQLVDQFTTYPEEQNRLSDRLNQHTERVNPARSSAEPIPVERKFVDQELKTQFTETLLLDEDPLPKASRSPTPPPGATLLNFDDEEVDSSDMMSSATPVPISHLEISGYNEFKDRATSFFKAGDYVSASEEYEKSLNSLPQRHSLRIVAHSNLVAALLKTGEYKRCISDTEVALELFPREPSLWNQIIPSSEPAKTFKEMWSKIVSRRAEAFEHIENYQEALKAYQSLIEKSCFNDKIMEGKRRCQKALNPPPSKPLPSKVSPESSPAASTTISTPEKVYANVQRVKEDNRREKALEAEKAALYDKVFDRVEDWKGTKGDDIRHLLANLSKVLTWCDWKPISTSDLVMPKRVKITYMRAVAKTHPDKVPATLDLESKMLAENVFSILSVAWEKFKSENNIN